jgi:hypothetical protein
MKKTLAYFAIIIIVLSTIGFVVASCRATVKDIANANQRWLTSVDGIKYKIVTIEGQKFIATAGAHGCLSLAGPIK